MAAQDHPTRSGKRRITYHPAYWDHVLPGSIPIPSHFLKKDHDKNDVAYFASPQVLRDALSAPAKSKVTKICIPEWSLSSAQAQCHILAALTQAAIQYHKPSLSSNIRTLFSPAVLEMSAIEAGLKLESALMLITADSVLDGQWEAQMVLSTNFTKDLDSFVKDDGRRLIKLTQRKTWLGECEETIVPIYLISARFKRSSSSQTFGNLEDCFSPDGGQDPVQDGVEEGYTYADGVVRMEGKKKRAVDRDRLSALLFTVRAKRSVGSSVFLSGTRLVVDLSRKDGFFRFS
ncbi:uncharacterized protein BT62DRAFT_1058179 [Guyanagaster necrorhizus]|uniref:Uncharacterized protein n=1 Tax=Guyanagaster necrorhizus TaxID=856835 RepID=A0A9P7VE91_9AGAR|nr:uncharacterized protein BT62DRAFT_1058179 [Guyanagaster necrorhizus MCA 3950]KAG7439306.1 hypothetical protein BT62DRAFT_1058179 [Guyanagaster necrorhizus MCA 3950]